jgi:hypothetical protein
VVCVGAGVDDAGLNAEFFPPARTALTDESCDLVRDLAYEVYFV